MNAGLLRETIQILTKVNTTDQYGGDIVDYQIKTNTKARAFIAKSDREFMNMGEFFGAIVTFHIRIYHNINNTDLVVWQDNRYRILSVFPDKTRQLIELKTELIKE